MNTLRVMILILYAGQGLIITALAVPLIRRRVGPNPLYGFRVRRTLEDPKVWYEANAFAGRSFLALGIVITVVSLALYFVRALDAVAYAIACLVILFSGLTVSVILSFRFLNRIPRE